MVIIDCVSSRRVSYLHRVVSIPTAERWLTKLLPQAVFCQTNGFYWELPGSGLAVWLYLGAGVLRDALKLSFGLSVGEGQCWLNFWLGQGKEHYLPSLVKVCHWLVGKPDTKRPVRSADWEGVPMFHPLHSRVSCPGFVFHSSLLGSLALPSCFTGALVAQWGMALVSCHHCHSALDGCGSGSVQGLDMDCKFVKYLP